MRGYVSLALGDGLTSLAAHESCSARASAALLRTDTDRRMVSMSVREGWIDAEQARLAELGLTPAVAVEDQHPHGRQRHLWAGRRWDAVHAELDASAGQAT